MTTKTTDRMRQALAWCDRRGLSPTDIYVGDDGDVEITFFTRGRADDSREGFVRLARAAGVLHVSATDTGDLWASSDVDGFDVTVFAGDWVRDVGDVGALVVELARELLAVKVPA